jgi:hypothetical protein
VHLPPPIVQHKPMRDQGEPVLAIITKPVADKLFRRAMP